MPTWTIAPEEDSYSLRERSQTARVALDGNWGRYFQKNQMTTTRITVRWLFEAADYTSFWTFYHDTLATGSLPFDMDLIGEDRTIANYNCRFIPGSVQGQQFSGEAYWVQATLDVELMDPATATLLPDCTCFDQPSRAIIGLGGLTLPITTFAASGTVVTAARAGVMPTGFRIPTMNASGIRSKNVIATGDMTLPLPTLDAVGEIPITGSMAANLPLPTLDAAGTATEVLDPFANTVSTVFNGTNEYFLTQSSSVFDFGQADPFSVSMWIKFDDLATIRAIYSNRQSGGGARGVILQRHSLNQFRFQIRRDGNAISLDSVTTVATDTWYHVVTTYDGSGDRSGMQIYVNGVLDVTGTAAALGAGSITTNQEMHIGFDFPNSQYHDGHMSHVTFWDKELSASEVKQLFGFGGPVDARLLSFYGNCIGDYWMGNGPGRDFTGTPTMDDQSGTGNHMNDNGINNANAVSVIAGPWAVMLGEDANYTLTGSDIITWEDSSGRGTDFGSDGSSNRPDNTGSLDSKDIANFDGVDERLRNTSPPVTNPDEISIVALFRRDSAFANTDAIFTHSTSGTVYIRFVVDSSGGVSFRYRTSSLGSERDLDPGTATVNQWHIASGILNRDQDQRARLDGGNEVSETNNDTAGNLTANAWGIGVRYSASPPSSPGEYFDGQIAAVVVLPYAYDSDVIRVIEENVNAHFGDPVTLV